MPAFEIAPAGLDNAISLLLGLVFDRLPVSALSLKQMYRCGSLQDDAGVSIASECGVLLPGIHAQLGTGASCTGIASRQWPETTIHLNAGSAYDREHSWNRTLGGIIE